MRTFHLLCLLLTFSLASYADLSSKHDQQVISWTIPAIFNGLSTLPLKYQPNNPICMNYTPAAWAKLAQSWQDNIGRKPSLSKTKKPRVIQRGVFIRRFYWIVEIPIELENKKTDNERVTLYIKVVNGIGQINPSGLIIQSLERTRGTI